MPVNDVDSSFSFTNFLLSFCHSCDCCAEDTARCFQPRCLCGISNLTKVGRLARIVVVGAKAPTILRNDSSAAIHVTPIVFLRPPRTATYHASILRGGAFDFNQVARPSVLRPERASNLHRAALTMLPSATTAQPHLCHNPHEQPLHPKCGPKPKELSPCQQPLLHHRLLGLPQPATTSHLSMTRLLHLYTCRR